MSTNKDNPVKEQMRELLTNLSEDEKKLLRGVIKAERSKIHMSNPRNINDDLWKVLTEIIK